MSSNNTGLTNEMKQAINARLALEWEQMAYSAEISVKVAKRLEDKAMEQRAVDQLTRAEKALDVLREELEQLANA